MSRRCHRPNESRGRPCGRGPSIQAHSICRGMRCGGMRAFLPTVVSIEMLTKVGEAGQAEIGGELRCRDAVPLCPPVQHAHASLVEASETLKVGMWLPASPTFLWCSVVLAPHMLGTPILAPARPKDKPKP